MVSVTREVGWRRPLARRSDALELLDLGRVTGAELRTNLDDLARLNRLPGGAAASVAAVRALAGSARTITILDVGTGAADVPLALARQGWTVHAVDADPAVLELARSRARAHPRVRVTAADATALPFDDRSVDVVHASLLLHHLDPGAAVAALSEMARVARLGVLVNDLRRGILPLLATGVAVATLARCRTTRHDGLLSVRRAYTLPELDGLLSEAGLRRVRRSAAWMPRVVTTAVHGARR